MLCVLAGCGREWVEPVQTDLPRKAQIRQFGLPHYLKVARQVGSFGLERTLTGRREQFLTIYAYLLA